MKTTIYLTRHGQTEWNLEKRLQGRGDSPLTQAGRARAEELAKRIASLELDTIYTSPIERARTTAYILKGEQSLPVSEVEGLMEMSFGDYEGRITDEIMLENPDWDMEAIMKGNVTMQAPNGETLLEVRKRVADTMDHLIEKNKGKTILVVTHGITLKALMHYFKDEEKTNEVMGQATLTKIEVDEACVSKIIFKNDGTHFTVSQEKSGW